MTYITNISCGLHWGDSRCSSLALPCARVQDAVSLEDAILFCKDIEQGQATLCLRIICTCNIYIYLYIIFRLCLTHYQPDTCNIYVHCACLQNVLPVTAKWLIAKVCRWVLGVLMYVLMGALLGVLMGTMSRWVRCLDGWTLSHVDG